MQLQKGRKLDSARRIVTQRWYRFELLGGRVFVELRSRSMIRINQHRLALLTRDAQHCR